MEMAGKDADNTRNIGSAFPRVLFGIGVAFTLTAPISIGLVYHDASTSWIAALCGAFVTFMSRFDSLSRFTLGPLKAEMREVISEANASLEQLREVATTFTDAALTDLSEGIFLGGLPAENRLDYHPKMIESLQKIGASKEQIKRAEAGWRNVVGKLYWGRLKKISKVSGLANYGGPGHELVELGRSGVAPTPEALEQALDSLSLLTSEARGWINDYRHFLATNEIRRRDELLRD